MLSTVYFNEWLIALLVISQITAEINLSPNALWDQNAITVAGWSNGTNGSSLTELNTPYGISITSNNVLYVSDSANNRIVVVDLTSTNNISIIDSGPGSNASQLNQPMDLFVTNTSLYVIDFRNHRVQKMSLNGSNSSTVPGLSGQISPFYLFVDNHDNIYLSDTENHRVLLFLSNFTNFTNFTMVAGTGVNGSNNNQLDMPYGVFVNQNGTIYVVDSYNQRVMKWYSGASAGVRVAGNGTSGKSLTQLSHPTQVIVDSNEYIYISEGANMRITRWAPNSNFGVCIAACTGTSGTASTQLNGPHSLTFDSDGSLYVSDEQNNRVQKFSIIQYYNVSYNQPKFSSCATWNPYAITFANESLVGVDPYGIFVDINNTVYVNDEAGNRVLIWLEGNMVLTRTLSGQLASPFAIFVTINGDIYVDNGVSYGRVDKWSLNATNSMIAMYVNGTCWGLFVDINDNIYCSLAGSHQVMKKSFNDNANISTIAAGTGSSGSTSNMLNTPRGIFVDMKFNLYVADCYNHRIQMFQSGQLNGTTLAGSGTNDTITLLFPAGVVLDGNGYLFIVDTNNNRIVGSGPSGFRCIVGCSNGSSSASNELHFPWGFGFDSYGNLFVTDGSNNRIQKFFLATNSCNETTTSQDNLISTADTTIQSTVSSTFITATTSTNTVTGSSTFTSATTSTNTVTGSSTFTTATTSTNNVIGSSTFTTATTSTNTVTGSYQSGAQPSRSFVPSHCVSSTSIGSNCNITTTPCDMLRPCQNNANCINNNLTIFGYLCLCPSGFNGIQCQFDQRPCQPNTCWNNGICYQTSNITFVCSCTAGWQDDHCQTKINYCENITCFNKGVCQPSFLNYTCLCLGNSYSGRYCEIIENQLTVHQIVSKSFAYIAIIAILFVAIFIVIMDVLKYCFGIDPVKKELKQKKYKKQKKKKKPPVVVRFIYVNVSSTQSSDNK